jgi:hypothetical protein
MTVMLMVSWMEDQKQPWLIWIALVKKDGFNMR